MSDAATDAESHDGSGRPGAAGALLFKERRRQGLSLGDISRQLKLSVRQVEALERDDYSGYKSPVFIHGFIRNYAKLLGLDPEPLIRATDSILVPPAIPAVAQRGQERSQSARPEDRKHFFWPAAVVMLVIAIAGTVYFGGRRAQDSVRSVPTALARDASAQASRAANEAKTGADAKPAIDTKPAIESAARSAVKPVPKAPAKVEAKAGSADNGLPIEPNAVVAPESAGRVTVRMIFEQESWVEIKDHTGNIIFGQLNSAGSRRSVSGEPPLSVVVGNAAGVRLFQGDKSIDLAPHTRVDVARLKLE